MSWAVATCLFWASVLSLTWPRMEAAFTAPGAFGFYCAICFVGWIFIVFCFPEVKGMPLEAIREVFAHGFGVRYARQWQKENKAFAKVNTQQSFAH